MKLARWFRNRRLDALIGSMARKRPRLQQAVDAIPVAIQRAWLAQAAAELPGWQPGEREYRLSAFALAQFFTVCAAEGDAACALPSKAADSIWHAWLREDAAGLARWQQASFGRTIPHLAAEALGAPLSQALARSFAGACRSERLSPLHGALPLMFAADGELAAPTGWAYWRKPGGRISYSDLDAQGRVAGTPRAHAGLSAIGLASLGLLSTHELAAHERQRERERHEGGSACGSGAISTASGCSSSADSGGCSCGSGCGGA